MCGCRPLTLHSEEQRTIMERSRESESSSSTRIKRRPGLWTDRSWQRLKTPLCFHFIISSSTGGHQHLQFHTHSPPTPLPVGCGLVSETRQTHAALFNRTESWVSSPKDGKRTWWIHLRAESRGSHFFSRLLVSSHSQHVELRWRSTHTALPASGRSWGRGSISSRQ